MKDILKGACESAERSIQIQPVKINNPKPYPSMPENQVCMENNCKDKATTDYNGHGHFVCEYHDGKLNDYFDEEYRLA